ncbi:MAG: hypothetical protein ABSC77_01665 [Terracidiphilus sp.]
MTQLNARATENRMETKLPLRDWILLPMLSLLTICLLAGCTELIARLMIPMPYSNLNECLDHNDFSTGVRAIPNSVCTGETHGSGVVEYRFNSCGHRAGTECGPKTLGTYRIVMVGTSAAMGSLVPREKTFATLLPAELSRLTGRKVELYNEAMVWETPHVVVLRINDVLAAKPDMILCVMTDYDIQYASSVYPPADVPEAPDASGTGGFLTTVINQIKHSRSGALLEVFFFKNQSSYVNRYLLGAVGPQFLRTKLSARLQHNLEDYDGYAADIERRAKAMGVQWAVVFVPSRARAAMISMGEWPAGYDPYKLSDELGTIVKRHGGTYIDILPGFRNIPSAGQYFFPIDNHPDARGHAIISGLIAKQLTNGAIPALNGTTTPEVIMGENR